MINGITVKIHAQSPAKDRLSHLLRPPSFTLWPTLTAKGVCTTQKPLANLTLPPLTLEDEQN